MVFDGGLIRREVKPKEKKVVLIAEGMFQHFFRLHLISTLSSVSSGMDIFKTVPLVPKRRKCKSRQTQDLLCHETIATSV